MLGAAAVIGRTFGLPLLGARSSARERLLPALSELQRLDLVVETRRRPAPEYRFRHGLVQEVAYASLLEARRRKLHGRVGEALEATRRGRPRRPSTGCSPATSARPTCPSARSTTCCAPGTRPGRSDAEQEALEHYGRARDFLVRLGDERRARETLFKIALAHHLAFDFERAEQAYDEAFCCRVEQRVQLSADEDSSRSECGARAT